ncbi:MAG: hypothetical protein AAF629_19620 [Chloroflexota bacterium]
MPTGHLTPNEIELYLSSPTSLEAKQLAKIKAHLRTCYQCQQAVDTVQGTDKRLRSTIKDALGEPNLPSRLKGQVRQSLAQTREQEQQSIHSWALVKQSLNVASTAVVIVLLAIAAWFVLRVPEVETTAGQLDTATPTQAPTQPLATPTPTILPPTSTSLSLNTQTPKSSDPDKIQQENPATPTATARLNTATATMTATATSLLPLSPTATATPSPTLAPPTATAITPEGLIAFSFFNPAPNRQVYEIHLLDLSEQAHRLFPLDGVSEPSLQQTNGGLHLSYRSWAEPTEPRALVSSQLDGANLKVIGGFWEDAQTDWSPLENTIIYASQREQDRRWRMYFSQSDGQGEVNLNLFGQNPSFAPDGQTFVYQGCDLTGNQCGLWEANIYNPASASSLLPDDRATAPDWSPNAAQIAYMANIDGNWDLYLVTADGLENKRLTTHEAIDGLPTWSPDGKWLAFLSNRDGDWGIWVFHLQTGQMLQVYRFDGGSFTPPHREPYGVRDWWDEQISWTSNE